MEANDIGKGSQARQNEESIPSDDEYEESLEDQIEVPDKNAVSEAIYQKYQQQHKQPVDSVIKEVDEEDEGEKSSLVTKFRLKNLDTGEEIEIEDEDMEESIDRKWSEGLSKIENFNNQRWIEFWTNVSRNNEKLRQYCEEGQYDEAQKMLQKGEDDYPVEVNYRGLDDWTPLHFACYEGHDDIIELLCEHEADVNAVTKFNRTGLHIATLRGHIEVVKILVNYKIDVDAYDNDGNTALHFAAENGYKQIIVFLLENKCKITKNKEGLTPIHDCCDETLKKVFHAYGFKEDGNYEQPKDKKSAGVVNRIERTMINSSGITPDDFVYHRLLGKGSFGEVFLVHKKDDQSKRLFAMKVLSKDKVMTKNLRRYALTERNVMSVINHPFMVKLHYAFQSSSKLFLVMEYYPGGDLGKLIGKKRAIPEEEARKYISELILAFEALHKNMIVFRDLKPDNVVLDSEGHCILTDFGLSKEGIYNNTTGSFCGSVAYLAPEILTKQGHSRTVDWYLLGLLLYELIVGLPPYYNSKKEVLFDNIKRGPLKIPKTMSLEAKDLIKKLLCRDPRKRLGAERDSEELKEHEFFKDVNWADVFNRKLQMPPIEEPKWNLSETIKVSFDSSDGGKKIEGWTFIAQQ